MDVSEVGERGEKEEEECMISATDRDFGITWIQKSGGALQQP